MVDPPAPGAPVQGDPRARVVIQEFADFQDPATVGAEAILLNLLPLYQGRVQLVWRELPRPDHTDGQLAGEAAAEALAQRGQSALWEMHDTLLIHQHDKGGLKAPALEGYARQHNLDLRRFRQALADHRHAPRRTAEMAVAERAKISTTPTFVINGYKVTGVQSLETFRRVVDQALRDLGEPLGIDSAPPLPR